MTTAPRPLCPMSRPRWALSLLLALFVVATVPTAIFGLRTYHSFLLLHSAYAVGAPDVSSIRAWMSLHYVADSFRVSETALIARLGLPAETDPDASIKSLAEREARSPFEYVQRAQRAVVEAAPNGTAVRSGQRTSWLTAVGDEFLAALLAYGYPVLGLTLLFGAIGLPVPTGLSAALAGTLAARGDMSWAWAATVAVTASVLGDAVGYGLGRAFSLRFLERHGRWFGYTSARRERVARLFERFGGLGVLLSRTLVSHLSAVLNLLAGAGRYRLSAFLGFTVVGRILWTSAYLGLGYAVGASLDAAAGFLANLSLFFVSLAVLVTAGVAVTPRRTPSATPPRAG